MAISVIIIFLIALGGLGITYIYPGGGSLMQRLAAGNIIGCAVFGLVAFIFASLFGLTPFTVVAALAITLAPVAIFLNSSRKAELKRDMQRARGKLDGANFAKMMRFVYYAFFLVLFWAFFERTMFETEAGIFTGGSQNMGDLPYHLGAIFGFTDGQNFPPQNPSYAGARFSYPFIADFLTACFAKLGTSVQSAMIAQNISWAFSLLVLLESFVVKLTANKLAGKIAPWILFFSGGLGFLWFFKDYWTGAQGLWEILWRLPRDYTIGENFRWGNTLVTLFITQRSLLLGLPLTLIVLGYLWSVFSPAEEEVAAPGKRSFIAPLVIGLLAGTLPLIHLHSLAVLLIAGVFLFLLKPERWREWALFAVGVSVIAVPELIWSMSGSANRSSEFFGWHFGWDSQDENFFKFWIKNTGFLIPVLIAGIVVVFYSRKRQETAVEDGKKDAGIPLLLFYLPFAFCFFVSNVAKLAPWEWDNIKVLVYWFVGSIPFMALAIAWAWEKGRVGKAAAIGCLAVLTLAGALDVWRAASGQINIEVFDRDAVQLAAQVKQKTPPNALFLNAPTYNSPVALTGRRSFMRYVGHLMSHGIDYRDREIDLGRIYEGGGTADLFIQKHNIDYVLISPEERRSPTFRVNESYFQKYPVVAESGQYKVYKVR